MISNPTRTTLKSNQNLEDEHDEINANWEKDNSSESENLENNTGTNMIENPENENSSTSISKHSKFFLNISLV